MKKGSKNWIFPDGDIPPPGDREPHGHESLVIINLNKTPAQIVFNIYFDNKAPVKNIRALVGAERVRCFRVDEGLGDEKKVTVPFGQYALVVHSSVPVVAQMGRMDVRQPNLAYYTTMGFPTT